MIFCNVKNARLFIYYLHEFFNLQFPISPFKHDHQKSQYEASSNPCLRTEKNNNNNRKLIAQKAEYKNENSKSREAKVVNVPNCSVTTRSTA